MSFTKDCVILLTVSGEVGAGGLAKTGEATRLFSNPPPGAEAVGAPSIVYNRQDNRPCNLHRFVVESQVAFGKELNHDVYSVICQLCNKVRKSCQFSASSSR
jgi:hypothetical protein